MDAPLWPRSPPSRSSGSSPWPPRCRQASGSGFSHLAVLWRCGGQSLKESGAGCGEEVLLACPSAGAPTPERMRIEVSSGSYGGSCRAASGNETKRLAAVCDGQTWCKYSVGSAVATDSTGGCDGSYVAEWRCGKGKRSHRAEVGLEIGHRKYVLLDCIESSRDLISLFPSVELPLESGAGPCAGELEASVPGSILTRYFAPLEGGHGGIRPVAAFRSRDQVLLVITSCSPSFDDGWEFCSGSELLALTPAGKLEGRVTIQGFKRGGVASGDQIALTGAPGNPHLHFEVN